MPNPSSIAMEDDWARRNVHAPNEVIVLVRHRSGLWEASSKHGAVAGVASAEEALAAVLNPAYKK